ncbi:SAM and SH3 domain-containing protein 3 [Oryzias melastigma]|uniref:SAM and SH3 domain containing 3 n=1 Tax=Oryzias melastigma TaxID=30732 RepID=A0A3B3C8Z9_ORYME|nr:SAM and SH3 domain-containing protein 3 isoform X2 [Oryzias melastigma]KAF6732401.1 SAM and SH3 domain-containing protein 3 [Oryzias melastigma]
MLRRKPSNASEKEQVQKKKLTLQRSSSFKDFIKNKPTSPVSADKEFALEESVAENGTAEESAKSGSKLGKKWRNVISRTMTRKTSKMVQKALAEEGGESGEELSPVSTDWVPDLCAGQRTSVCSTGSEDTTPSPISRQLSASSDRQSLDSGYSQRDSMRLEESGVSYNGPFCGRAVVHTDFTPSPYDVESLKLQKGDIIHIIDKPPVGTWTGKLNNKVGSFKFIYVTLLSDESPQARKRHSKSQKFKTTPKTLEEVLVTIGLTELSSVLSMHGFQSLEDFAGLRESHLNELNITDPDKCSKILNAIEMLRDSDEESEPEKEEEEPRDKSREEPRDSGCFESSENLEGGREDPKSEEKVDQETGKHEAESEEKENQTQEVDAVQEQLQELTVDEGP